MELHIIEHIAGAISVIIKCQHADEQVMKLKEHIELFDQTLKAKKDNEFFLVNIPNVLYFESVDNRTFLYTQNEVMEIKQRLYELELILSVKDFIRISKSQIVNLNKIDSLKPQLNRTILATMCNGEQLYISRKYVPLIRKLLSI